MKRIAVSKTITVEMIRSWEPCYDPVTGESKLPEDWTGTVFDIMNLDIPFEDKLWVIARNDLMSEKLMRLFAVWCARQLQHLIKDERSIKAIDVAEAFANGEATKEELSAAWDAVYDAACDAAYAAARQAAYVAVYDAAWSAARQSAMGAAKYAARDAQEKKLREMLKAGVETGDTVSDDTHSG